MGLAAGAVITLAASRIAFHARERSFTAENEELTKQNEELQAEVSRVQAVENSAELLKSDSENWALALVNEGHPLDTSYEPAELTEIESERSVDSRIAEPLQKMLDDAAQEGLSMYVASA